MVSAASEDYFDQKLATWFAQHGRPWSGTASELLAALRASCEAGSDVSPGPWPQSFRALYSQIESHRQRLRSLGVDLLLHAGPPRMISLRSCSDERPEGKSSSSKSAATLNLDPPVNPDAQAHDQKAESGSDNISPTRDEAHTQEIAPPSRGGIFKSTPEARFALVEIRVQIKEQGLQLEPAIELVVRRTQEITQSCGVAVGLLQEDSVVYPSRTGVATAMGTLHFQANLFQSCLKTGRMLQLRDARNHPLVGATCRQEGIGSLIIVPLFHNREVAGAIEFLFRDRRSFSIGDVMDLELIAGIISESLSDAERMESKPEEARQSLPQSGLVEGIELQVGDSLSEKESSVHEQPAGPFAGTSDDLVSVSASSLSESRTTNPDAAPMVFRRASREPG
jgi:GAF domain-containing protein